MIRVVVFDFDGVLVESNCIKRDAFPPLFPPQGQAIVREVLAEDRDMPRDAVVRVVLRRLGQEPDDSRVRRLTGQYDTAVRGAILALGVTPEVRGVLDRLASTGFHLYVNSGTPEASLRAVVDGLGLADYFQEILGAPASKTMNLSRVLHEEGASGNEVAVVGDGGSDLRAALTQGCLFIGVANADNGWPNETFPIILNLGALPDLLEGINA